MGIARWESIKHSRREVIKAALYGAAAMAVPQVCGSAAAKTLISKRPPMGQRKFVSRAIEETIARVKSSIGDPELAWMFENCYPNTLDTTVELSAAGGKPDTFIITGVSMRCGCAIRRARWGRT